jgi:Putative Flp pilus-assembly TadE/G-like
MRWIRVRQRRPRRGMIAVQVALSLTAVLGAAAIVTDLGLLQAERRHAQSVADAAALAAGITLYNGGSSSAITTAAQHIASANGYTNDGTNSIITVNIPPSSPNPKYPNFAGKSGYVEVIAQYYQERGFSGIWGSDRLPVQARAVARETMGAGTSILALNSGNTSGALTLSGSSTITVPGTVIVDGSNTSATKISGSTGLVSPEIDLVGNFSGTSSNPNNRLETGSSVLHTGTPTVTDPLAGLPVPDPSTLTSRDIATMPTVNGAIELSQGVYTTSNISFSGGNVRLVDSGIYYFNGKLTFSGSGTIFSAVSGTAVPAAGALAPESSRTNVMIYIDPGTNTQSLTVSGWALQLRPPASGTYQGISIFQRRDSTAKISMSNLKTYTLIEGTIYAAASAMTLSGGSDIIVGSSFISDTMTLSGSSSFTIPPPKIPTPGLAKRDVRLVE